MFNYPTVKAWHILTGSHGFYVKDQVAQAQLDNAPVDATFKTQGGVWVELHNVENKKFAEEVWKLANKLLRKEIG